MKKLLLILLCLPLVYSCGDPRKKADYIETELKKVTKVFIDTTYANGDKYVGEFKDNKPHGQGTFTSADGDKYVGEFKDDKIHGQGTLILADGTVYKGLWENDEFIGEE